MITFCLFIVINSCSEIELFWFKYCKVAFGGLISTEILICKKFVRFSNLHISKISSVDCELLILAT